MQLGISKSKLKLVETNRRTLTSNEMVRLAAMEIQLAALPAVKKSTLLPCVRELYDRTNTGYALDIRHRQNHCNLEVKRREKKLAKMIVEYDSLLICLRNMDSMESAGLDPRDTLVSHFMARRPQLLKRLAKCGPQEQAKLRQRIALLRAEAALIQSIQPRYVHTNEEPSIISPLNPPNMDYSVSQVSTRAECQELIDKAIEQKDTLAYRKTGLARQVQSASTNSVSIEADLAAATAELSALQTVYDSLPAGETKDDTFVKLKKVEYRKFLLEERKGNYGTIELLDKQFDIAIVERSLLESDAYILALTTRMNELPMD